ncbi:MAG: M3 family peptidase [Gammaproteobacteria bacterium]|nr:M3 family peptidase [Gammaproteobacteria bacterium]
MNLMFCGHITQHFCYNLFMNRLLPKFDRPLSTIGSQLVDILKTNVQKIEQLTAQEIFTWHTLITPLDDLNDQLDQFWSPIAHLHSVADEPELRAVYNEGIVKITEYGSEVGQNKNLYNAYLAIKNSPEFKTFNIAQQKVIDNNLRDFRLAGVDLSEAKKEQFKNIEQQLAALNTQFEEHVLDAMAAWKKHITDETELAGLPLERKQLAANLAREKNLSGWLLTLDQPCYHDVIQYADSRNLREELYLAYATRASDKGPTAGQFDNSAVMVELLKLNQQKAQLLGFKNYAQLSLATKMVEMPEDVITFSEDLVKLLKPKAQQELDELTAFAATTNAKGDLEQITLTAWDIAYYTEKLRQQKYHISQEEIRHYFPVEHVLQGLFSIVEKLYGIKLQQKHVPVWHPDVRFYELVEDNKIIGGVYLDLFVRPEKRSGAWMDECITRRRLADHTIQLPIAFLTCNFAPSTAEQPALLTHDDVVTLFHEMGHCLQHLLTQMEYLDISGINGVPWDAVELPSQFFEGWCWDAAALKILSSHYQTKQPLSDEKITRLIAAKNFHAALHLIRQLEFGLFDMLLYQQTENISSESIQQLLDRVRQHVAVITLPVNNRFQHSFTHIFGGGYGAGYYSYLWAEVLARDAFAAFKETDIFNRELGEKFKNTILAQGGSRHPLAIYHDFRGRAPQQSVLLAYYGL